MPRFSRPVRDTNLSGLSARSAANALTLAEVCLAMSSL